MTKLQLDWEGYYPMEERSIRDKVRDRSGVYKISVEQKDGSLKPIFAGQAPSLRMRLLEQLTTTDETCVKKYLKEGKCLFRFAYLYTQDELDTAERALYKRYTPRCNEPEKVPDTQDVEVNTN